MFEEQPREVRMAEIRDRVRRIGRSGALAHVDRRFLLAEVDRLAAALADVEHEANRRVREKIQEEALLRDGLSSQLRQLKEELQQVKRNHEESLRNRSEWHTKYLLLSQSVARLTNRNLRHSPSDLEVLMGAMSVHTAQVEEECTQKIHESTVAIEEADRRANIALETSEKERDIRRRVQERFKRVRREVILASETIKKQRLDLAKARHELEQEREFGLNARRFAALAYRALDSEDLEDRGQEPMWP